MTEIITPAVTSCGCEPLRADAIDEAGHISTHVINRLRTAPLAIADLTFLNANVFYELGLRHAMGKPVSLLAATGTDVPFDVSQLRLISFTLEDPVSVEGARAALVNELRSSIAGKHEPLFESLIGAELTDEQSLSVIALHQASAAFEILRVIDDEIARTDGKPDAVDEDAFFREVLVALMESRQLCVPFRSRRFGDFVKFFEEDFSEQELKQSVVEGAAILRTNLDSSSKRRSILAILQFVQTKLRVKMAQRLGRHGIRLNSTSTR